MIRALLASLALCAVLAAGDALPPHQGTVVLEGRSFADVWIFSETTENCVHTLDSKKDSATTTTTPRKNYLRVDYARPIQVEWIKGDIAAGKGQWAEAATLFLEAAKKADSWYTRENAFLRAAEAFNQAKKPDDAVKALDGLLAFNPKTVEQARATYLRGQALRQKGDSAGAVKAFAELAKGPAIDAIALGALGQGELFSAENKHEDAAKALAAAFARLDPGKHPEYFGQIGVALAIAQQSAGQNEPAIATLRRLAYGAEDDATRARAHLAWAKLLAGNEATLFEAFEHAAMAWTARGAGAVSEQGGALCRQISQRIDKLPEAQASNDVKAEYRRYLTR